MEQEKSGKNAKGGTQAGDEPVRSNTDVLPDGGSVRSSDEGAVMVVERRGGVKRTIGVEPPAQRRGKSLPTGFKVLPITISQVSKAYEKVRRNGGSAGVDGQSLADFAEDLTANLYRLWNRLSSGSYHPSPVREVEIPKGDGGIRKLGIPTVEDRIAQQVIKSYLEPRLDRLFHPHSYGYRRRRSAHQALCEVRRQCRSYAYAIDMDIKSFFDEVSHDLLLRALRKHVSEKWVLRLVEQWLRAPIAEAGAGGKLRYRIGRGTPQGGVISPLLANLFLHYVLDEWLARKHPGVALVRYADDAIIHCRTGPQAEEVLDDIAARLTSCGLRLHPTKTKIVFCKQSNRGWQEPDYAIYFDFLGHRFRPRTKRNRWGVLFTCFDGAISPKAERRITEVFRKDDIQNKPSLSLEQIAQWYEPKLRAYYAYYGAMDAHAIKRIFYRFNYRLLKWAMKKYKGLRTSHRRACDWIKKQARDRPGLFHHWSKGITYIAQLA